MNRRFTTSVTRKTRLSLDGFFLKSVVENIYQESGVTYGYVANPGSILMKPRTGLGNRSFWPEVEISLEKEEALTVLHITCRPMEFVRVFLAIYFGFAMVMEAIGILLVLFGGLEKAAFAIIPWVLCVAAWLMAAIGTDVCSKKIIKAMEQYCVS